MRKRVLSAAALAMTLAGSLVLVGCSGEGSGLSEQWSQGGDKGYVAGDGSTTSFAPADRGEPVAFEGVTEHGEQFSSEQTLGSVTVVNFWYAGCAPCRAEAPQLVEVFEEFQAEGVQFVGVNTRDQEAQAVQFAEEFGVNYPSVMDNAGSARRSARLPVRFRSTPCPPRWCSIVRGGWRTASSASSPPPRSCEPSCKRRSTRHRRDGA